MHALSSPMGVECGIACHFGLGGSHALEIERMHWMWDMLLHDCENSFLSLQRTHAVKGRRDNSDVKVVARAVQVNHLNDPSWKLSVWKTWLSFPYYSGMCAVEIRLKVSLNDRLSFLK